MEIKTIGHKIATARKEKNMSQVALAGLLFISPQAVGNRSYFSLGLTVKILFDEISYSLKSITLIPSPFVNQTDE